MATEVSQSQASQIWSIAPSQTLSLDRHRLMGIVNVTPDSFSDGGRWLDSKAAVDHGLSMVEQGAAILDVGGESSRPGAERVLPDQQISRVKPVIEGLSKQTQALISIDTTSSVVAQAALDAGASIINDISGGTEDTQMLPLAAKAGCGLILMHRLVASNQDHYAHQHPTPPEYEGGVVEAVQSHLSSLAEAALAAGIEHGAIVLDPGLGFGKDVEQNLALVRSTDRLSSLGYPLLSGASRKSFLGAMINQADPVGRDTASVAVSVLHYQAGVRLFRVHNVAAHEEALKIIASLDAIGSGSDSC